MSDLIDRQAALDALNIPDYENGEAYLQYESDVNAIRSLQAQPERKKGKWVEVTDGICIWKVCDQCGEKPLWNEWRTDRDESNYCPNCGSYNGGEQDD